MARSSAVTGGGKARLLLVDDHPVTREGMALLISVQPDLEVWGEAEDMPSALALLGNDRPDLAVIDLSLKRGNGLDLIKHLRARDETIRALVYSAHDECLFAERAFRAGAMGYVHKGRQSREILDAIRTVLTGRVYCSGELSDELLHRLVGATRGGREDRPPIDSLSDQELEVFRLMGNGLTTERIADHMRLSPKTVETYRARIKAKLSLDNMTELIQRATRWVVECD